MSLAVLALMACTRGGDDSGHPDTSVDSGDTSSTEAGPLLRFDGDPPTNVVVFVIDTMRRDRIALYPNAFADAMPNVDALADHLVLQTNFTAASTWTSPTTTSLLTSDEPIVHGAVYGGQPVRVTTWPSRLHDAGWTTAEFSANIYASVQTGMDQTFDSSFTDDDIPAEELAGHVVDWVDQADFSRPVFLHVQPRDPHRIYAPPDSLRGTFEDTDVLTTGDDQDKQLEAYASMSPDDKAAVKAAAQGLYSEEVLEADRGLAQLLQGLDAAGHLDDTLVVITADHGEELDDNDTNFFGHNPQHTAHIVDLPLMFYNPRLSPGTIDALWSQVDVLPTVLAPMGVALPDDIDGVDRAAVDRASVVTTYLGGRSDSSQSERSFSITDGLVRVKLKCDGTVEAYDRAADPDDVAPLGVDDVSNGQALLDEMTDHLKAQLAASDFDYPCDTLQ